ncbi:hypothetical protein [Nocardia acidivorans]|uniref:hypothetical protein n=1 Tax=Nocardia acidivorans TaxID=404580 RepID=UPI000830EE0C|nr:hypothetical protein [Nocardia acidivorans]
MGRRRGDRGTTGVAVLNIKTNARVTGVFLAIEVAAIAVLVVLGFANVERGLSEWLRVTTGGPDRLTRVGASALALCTRAGRHPSRPRCSPVPSPRSPPPHCL